MAIFWIFYFLLAIEFKKLFDEKETKINAPSNVSNHNPLHITVKIS